MPDRDLCGINKFVERDIDMLLAEELRVNAKFVERILTRFGLVGLVRVPAAHTNVSVVEDGSEADVVATFVTNSGGHHRLFIENKIDAMLMPEQLERYIRRGEGEVRRGIVSAFSVLFFTPSIYQSVELPHGVRQLSFEDAAAMLNESSDLRSQYRASLLLRAIPLRTPVERDAHVAASDPYIKEWWNAVYAMLEREYPGFFRHKTKYPRSVYFAPETAGQASYLRVDFKGHKGEVDLAFKNIPIASLRSVVASLPAHPGHIVANDRSSAIRISGLEPFVISDGMDIIGTKVRAAYTAARDLLMYWNTNRQAFDRMAASQASR